MNYLLTSLIILSIVLLMGLTNYPPKPSPKWNDWICWHTSKKDVLCGTYGWSKSKMVAKRKSNKLCQSTCSYECKLEYCERLKKNKSFPRKDTF